MMTGKDPGALGIYGFRNRRDHTYDGLHFASSRLVNEPALWDILGEHGVKTIALGVPLTYPPRPINGLMITDFLAPDTRSDYTYPSELKDEIRNLVGEYLFDTRQFRTENKCQLLEDIRKMTSQRFTLARYLMNEKPWDMFVMVEMGPDRMHHGFWKYFDSDHPLYIAGNPYENAIRDYYIQLDEQIGELTDELKEGDLLLIVSDHGAKRMVGGICLNQWLIDEGYLTLKVQPAPETKFSPELVDWSRTRAWGDGGYYGRLFLNVKGREPEGVVAPDEVSALKAEITAKLERMCDRAGALLNTRVFRPETIYSRTNNVAPDLIIYFGDLYWRSVGSVGHESIYTATNDTGPDDANHAQFGICIMKQIGSNDTGAGELTGLSLYDVAPTILNYFGVSTPLGVGRNRLIGSDVRNVTSDAYSMEEEAELARRLEDLGYL